MGRIVRIVCAAIFVPIISLLISCEEENVPVVKRTDDSIIPEKTVTLQVFNQLTNFSGEQPGWFAKIMLDKFNVKLNIIPGNGNAYATRMENGNLGDIVIWGSDSNQYMDALKSGLLYDWEEDDLLTDYGPYIKSNMWNALEKNRKLSGNKKVYGFGHGVSNSSKDRQEFMYTWDLRYDLYESLGKPEIKDLDDLHNVLKRMKNICPTDDNGRETYGVSLFSDWDGCMVMYVKALCSALVGWDEFGYGLYDPLTGRYHPCLEEDGVYLKSLKFLNELYRDRLLDPDSQIQTYNMMFKKYKDGTAFWNIFHDMAAGAYNFEKHTDAGKAMYPVVPASATPICYGQSVYGGNRVWSIGAKTEYPELCMTIINWLSTPEGVLTTLYGPKGVTWDYDGNRNTYFTDFGKKCQRNDSTEMKAPYPGRYREGSYKLNNITWDKDALNPESNGETFNKLSWLSEETSAQSEIEESWRNWTDSSSVEEYLEKGTHVFSPASIYSNAPLPADLEAISKQCANIVKMGSWRAIYANNAEEFETIIDNMVMEAQEYGIDRINNFYRDEAAKRKSAEDKMAIQ